MQEPERCPDEVVALTCRGRRSVLASTSMRLLGSGTAEPRALLHTCSWGLIVLGGGPLLRHCNLLRRVHWPNILCRTAQWWRPRLAL